MEEATPIGPERRRWKRFLIPAAWILAAQILVVAFLCAFFDVRCVDDLWAYRCMMKGPLHPIWKDLALRRIHKGSDLSQIVRKYPHMKQELWEPYTVLSYPEAGETDNRPRVIATRGVLVYADVSGFWYSGFLNPGSRWGRWDYVFFSDPAHDDAMREAYRRHLGQVRLEKQAWWIHRAIATGQDVFLSSRIECREADASSTSRIDAEMLRQYEQIYGKEMARQMGFCEATNVTAEVSKVLSGDLELGTLLTFSAHDCNEADLAEAEPVILHVYDLSIILPNSKKGGERYLTVPRRALEWYQSRTPEQIKDFDARCTAREAEARD
jgi:hypothetical protein